MGTKRDQQQSTATNNNQEEPTKTKRGTNKTKVKPYQPGGTKKNQQEPTTTNRNQERGTKNDQKEPRWTNRNQEDRYKSRQTKKTHQSPRWTNRDQWGPKGPIVHNSYHHSHTTETYISEGLCGLESSNDLKQTLTITCNIGTQRVSVCVCITCVIPDCRAGESFCRRWLSCNFASFSLR